MYKISIDRLYLAYLKGRVDGMQTNRRTLSKEQLLQWLIEQGIEELKKSSDSDLDI